jgi:hypothetical protein
MDEDDDCVEGVVVREADGAAVEETTRLRDRDAVPLPSLVLDTDNVARWSVSLPSTDTLGP